MRRFLLLLSIEIKLIRTAWPIHIVALLQPALMFSLMAFVLVKPTFEMNLQRPTSPEAEALARAMEQVGSPIGEAYIQPILLDVPPGEPIPSGQLVTVETQAGRTRAVQSFGLIDSNLVKNFRNRLTSAGLILWEKTLGSAAIELVQIPLLPRDVSYRVYFGLAMLPLAAFIGGAFVGAFLTAQEFEFQTIQEYRLAPAPWPLVLSARLLRLCLTGLASAIILGLIIFLFDQVLPSSLGSAGLALLLMSLIGACVGTLAALMMRNTLPAFVIGLASAFFTWIMGGAFGLPAGFGGLYEAMSRWMPNTYAVYALYRLYYPLGSSPGTNIWIPLGLFAGVAVLGVMALYWRVVVKDQEGVG